MKQRNTLIFKVSHVLIGIGFVILYVHHVRSVFETRTNFSHLSKISRESLLRKEDALYYSFYKTIVEETTFWQGYNKLLNLTSVEYPNSVNVVKRFHVLPEIFISFLYHHFKDVSQNLGLQIISCWKIERPSEGDSIITCEGPGEPFHFYLEFVWFLGGFTVIIIYIYGACLSENIFGGIYAVVLYIIFHKNANKIYEKPVARENFAFPFIFWQLFYLSMCIEQATKVSSISIRNRIIMITKLTTITTISLLCWQFSSIIYATQILIMITPWSLGLVSNCFSIDYTISQFASNIIAYYCSYGNKKYFLSWQNGPALALLFISLARLYKSRMRRDVSESYTRNVTLGILTAISCQDLLEKSGYAKADDNPYSVYRDLVLHWGLQRRANFTTTLLACSNDFAEVKVDDFWEFVTTLFVKPYCLYGVVVLAKFLRTWRIREPRENQAEHIERSKKYVLEDFLEENRISMQEMTNKETEKDLKACLKLLEECNYNYEKYKVEKHKLKKTKADDKESFFNDVKKLKDQISEIEKRKEKKFAEENNKIKIKCEDDKDKDKDKTDLKSDDVKTESIPSDNTKQSKETTTNHNPKRPVKDTNSLQEIGYHYLYSVAQLATFFLMGIGIRKLFFLCYTLGCVMAPTLCSRFWFKKQNNVFWTISLVVFLTSIIDPGLQNLQEEYLPPQTSNNDLETMLDWISMNTEKDAIFGGPVEVIGNVHLSTRRPIVNHAHLEMRQISDRTESIYSVFSRQQSSDIYNQCSQLKLQYLILSFEDCSNSTGNECDILTIWDEMQPSYRKYPQFCAELVNKNIPSFLKVFSNKNYGIIKMFSQSVQLNLKLNKMPEKHM